MRISIAALMAAIIMFVWGFVAYMILPIGEMGFHQPNAEDPIIAAVQNGVPSEGIYMLPNIAPEDYQDEAKAAAFTEKALSNPYVMVVYSPEPADPMDMGKNLGIQFVSLLLASLLAAFAASFAKSFGQRWTVVMAIAGFGWLMHTIPMWNWYRFPADFVLGRLIEHGVGWGLAGLAIAWWLSRGSK